MKQSDLLRKQADMMDMAEKYGINGWRNLVLYKTPTDSYEPVAAGYAFRNHTLLESEDYKFALGVVEGKPVFEGDELYCSLGKYKVESAKQFVDTPNTIHFYGGVVVGHVRADRSTWTPPKPKTVMVELLREDAEKMAEVASDRLAESYAYDRVGIACRKALEET